jgi:hypothetical protein
MTIGKSSNGRKGGSRFVMICKLCNVRDELPEATRLILMNAASLFDVIERGGA